MRLVVFINVQEHLLSNKSNICCSIIPVSDIEFIPNYMVTKMVPPNPIGFTNIKHLEANIMILLDQKNVMIL